jgi:Tripartite tricarboxylate transporter family receptor
LNELIVWLKANPGKALQGTAGVGSPAHVSGAYFQKETGTRFQFVPYRGAAFGILCCRVSRTQDPAFLLRPPRPNIRRLGFWVAQRATARMDGPVVS